MDTAVFSHLYSAPLVIALPWPPEDAIAALAVEKATVWVANWPRSTRHISSVSPLIITPHPNTNTNTAPCEPHDSPTVCNRQMTGKSTCTGHFLFSFLLVSRSPRLPLLCSGRGEQSKCSCLANPSPISTGRRVERLEALVIVLMCLCCAAPPPRIPCPRLHLPGPLAVVHHDTTLPRHTCPLHTAPHGPPMARRVWSHRQYV